MNKKISNSKNSPACNNSKQGSNKTNKNRAQTRRSKGNRNDGYQPKKEFDQAQDYAKDNAYSNDPAWYASDPTLAKDSASIPFSWATGTTSNLGGVMRQYYSNNAEYFTAPGICALYLRPSGGESSSPNSPLNVAATALYSYVRHANSGSANYDSPDLMLYVMAMGDIVAMTNFMIRAYGVASLYSTRNRYLPDALLKAMHIDPDDLRTNLAQFRYGINLIMSKISSLAVPSTFSYLKRKAFLYSGIYTEGTSAKDQMYLYVPASYYQLDVQTDTGTGDVSTALKQVTYLDPMGIEVSSNYYTVNQLLTILNNMVDPMIKSEDMNIMSGDILKAYGTSGIIKFGRLLEDYSVPIGFDIAVLEQIKNATTQPLLTASLVQSGLGNITQDSTKGYLVTNESIKLTSPGTAGWTRGVCTCSNQILTTTTADVSPELVLESTRLMLSGTYNATTNTVSLCPSSEVCVGTILWYYAVKPDSVGVLMDMSYYTTEAVSSGAGIPGTFVSLQSMLASFKFAPRADLATYATVDSSSSIDRCYRGISFDNYAILTPEDIKRMNEACMLNMLHVPSIGSVF